MAVGCSALSGEEDQSSVALKIPEHQMHGDAAQPLNSLHHLPQKRPLERACHSRDPGLIITDLAPAQKWQKMSADLEPAHSMVKRSKQELQCRSLEEAMKVAMKLYTQAFTSFVLLKDLKDEEAAEKFASQWAAKHYEELKSATLGLLPWMGEMTASVDGSYDVISFQRRRTPLRSGGKLKSGSVARFREELRNFRLEGERSRAWEALCAVLAAISSREEKAWLENFDVDDDLDKIENQFAGCRRKGGARRRAVILDMIPRLIEEEGAGSFADHMVDPTSLQRVTFAHGPAGPVPATSMSYRRMPFWDALKTMDDDGPLRGAAARKDWVQTAGREFAFQDLQFGHEATSRKGRTCAQSLKPNPQIRNLLRSKKPVILLDTLAALGPRDMCKIHGLSNIVQSELATLFRDAKARGEAVAFCLGTSSPHKLAQKVYLRPPLPDYGLRIGYLRWREAAGLPWAREFGFDDRTVICLQMP